MGSLARRFDNEGDVQQSESVRKFFQLPWFSRRWVIQEAVLNPDVIFHCGNSEISWPRLHLAIQAMPSYLWNDTSDREVRNALHKFGDLWRTWSYLDQKSANCELFELMDSFHHFQCKEAKDRIYALASLSSDVQISAKLIPITTKKEQIPLVPNYSLSDDEVFRQLALGRMQSGRVFTTLAWAAALQPRDSFRTLPSWVPDFRCSKRWRPMLKEEPESANQTVAALRHDGTLLLRTEMCTPSSGPSTSVGTFGFVENIFSGPCSSDGAAMLQFVSDCIRWIDSRQKIVDFEEVFAKIRFCNFLLDIAAKFGKEEFIEETTDLVLDTAAAESQLPDNFRHAGSSARSSGAFLASMVDSNCVNPKDLKAMMPHLLRMYNALSGRDFFLTTRIRVAERNPVDKAVKWGHQEEWWDYDICLFGIGPGGLLAGDSIIRFFGKDEGLFFRSEGAGRYRVIGDGHFAILGPEDQRHEVGSESRVFLLF
ncbi:hypothetical protein V8E51_001276 [Hyaloscypha variabilis]|jgi:hypothetical protein